MSSIQHVSRKDGTYHFRRSIRLGDDKPFRLRISLKTMSHARARILAPALTVASEALRMNMMQNMARDGLSAEQRAEIFRRQMHAERDRLEIGHAQLQLLDHGAALPEEVLRFGLDAGEAVSLDRTTNGNTGPALVIRIPPDDAPADVPIEIFTLEDYICSLGADDAEDTAVLQLSALDAPQTALNLQMAMRVINAAKVEAIREYRERIVSPGAAYPSVPVTAFEAPSPVIHVASVGRQIAPPAEPAPLALASQWSTMTASEAASKFIAMNPRTGGHDGEARRKGSSWTEKTREQFKLPALLLQQVMGGRPLGAVTQDDLVELDRCFNNLYGPNFRKSERQRGMTIYQIVEEVAEQVRKKELAVGKIGLGVGTTNRHWGFLRQLTGWFGTKCQLDDLDYSAFVQNDDRDPRTLRDTYSIEEGQEVFSMPPWTGCKSLSRRLVPGDLIVHDAGYFVPIIAWFTGLRREEICGLTLDDIEFEDGFWHFNIRDNVVRSLKTSTSTRLVPFAEELVRLRLVEYVEKLRAEGETLLFPELETESGKSSRGEVYYRIHWEPLRHKLSFLERGQAVHSFRHTLTDELKAKSVFEEVRADLVGHRIKTETGGRYSKAARLEILREAVAKVPEVTKGLLFAPPLSILPRHKRAPRKARPKR